MLWRVFLEFEIVFYCHADLWSNGPGLNVQWEIVIAVIIIINHERVFQRIAFVQPKKKKRDAISIKSLFLSTFPKTRQQNEKK